MTKKELKPEIEYKRNEYNNLRKAIQEDMEVARNYSAVEIEILEKKEPVYTLPGTDAPIFVEFNGGVPMEIHKDGSVWIKFNLEELNNIKFWIVRMEETP